MYSLYMKTIILHEPRFTFPRMYVDAGTLIQAIFYRLPLFEGKFLSLG